MVRCGGDEGGEGGSRGLRDWRALWFGGCGCAVVWRALWFGGCGCGWLHAGKRPQEVGYVAAIERLQLTVEGGGGGGGRGEGGAYVRVWRGECMTVCV